LTRSSLAYRRAQSGIGLVEIIVCLVLLSFGFLVVAQMQLQGIRTSQSAFRMSQASYMITEMMDRINRNPQGLASGAYANKTTGASAIKPNCATTGCTPAQSAELDLYEWSAHLHNLRGLTGFSPLIPADQAGTAPTASIDVDVNGVYSITVAWAETIGDSEEQRDLVVEFIP